MDTVHAENPNQLWSLALACGSCSSHVCFFFHSKCQNCCFVVLPFWSTLYFCLFYTIFLLIRSLQTHTNFVHFGALHTFGALIRSNFRALISRGKNFPPPRGMMILMIHVFIRCVVQKKEDKKNNQSMAFIQGFEKNGIHSNFWKKMAFIQIFEKMASVQIFKKKRHSF